MFIMVGLAMAFAFSIVGVDLAYALNSATMQEVIRRSRDCTVGVNCVDMNGQITSIASRGRDCVVGEECPMPQFHSIARRFR